MLTTLNAACDRSNNKYMGRYNVGALKEYFDHLNKHFTNLKVTTALQLKEV